MIKSNLNCLFDKGSVQTFSQNSEYLIFDFLKSRENPQFFKISVKKVWTWKSPLVELQPEKTVFQGKILTLVCDIKKGAREPTLTWEKDGNVLASNSKIYISPDRSQLQIFSIQVSDAGLYKCVGDNIAGHTEASTKVEVLQSPKLEESFEEIEAVEADDLELSCISDVKPLPEVTW